MPLLRGQSLSEVISREAPLSIERIIDISRQVLRGLAAAHTVGITHRDLKPDNLFLTTVGDRQDFVKILDFGVSKVLWGSLSSAHRSATTGTGAAIGTPGYMAPEQARGETTIDHRVDVFAVGAILYEMITGRRAIEGASSNQILWNLWNEPISPPRLYRPDCPPELEAAVLTALNRDRGRRYSSSSAFEKAITDIRVHQENKRLEGLSAEVSAVSPGATRVTALTASMTPVTSRTPMSTSAPITLIKPSQRRSWLLGGGVLGAVIIAFAISISLFGHGGAFPTTNATNTTRSEIESSALADDEGATVGVPAAPLPSKSSRESSPAHATPTSTSEADLDEASSEPSRITLQGMPRGAVVTVAGQRQERPIVELPPTGAPVSVVVRALGYRPWRRTLSPDGPKLVVVRMHKRVAKAPAKAALEGAVSTFEEIP